MASNKIIYISGPMTGYEYFNFEAFDKASHKLKELGHKVINPAQIARDLGFNPRDLSDDWNWNKLPDDISLDTIKGVSMTGAKQEAPKIPKLPTGDAMGDFGPEATTMTEEQWNEDNTSETPICPTKKK